MRIEIAIVLASLIGGILGGAGFNSFFAKQGPAYSFGLQVDNGMGIWVMENTTGNIRVCYITAPSIKSRSFLGCNSRNLFSEKTAIKKQHMQELVPDQQRKPRFVPDPKATTPKLPPGFVFDE